MRIAVLNVGSGTVKAAVAEASAHGARVLAARSIERRAGGEDLERAVRRALGEVGAHGGVEALVHRLVHGGVRYVEPLRVDERVLAELEQLSGLAPLHNGPALAALRVSRALFDGLPEVAVFDTAFHSGRAQVSTRYALPWQLADELGLRRFGFHGLAHESLLRELARAQECARRELSAVTLQLGAGCSAAAIEAGRSVETSMGFSPLEGLVMATRSGDVDPAVVLHLLRRGHTVDGVEELLNRRSGLVGLCGHGDMRAVLEAEARGEERARLAVALFVRRIVMTAGAYLTLLGGRGAIVFGGGIGENSPEIRRRVCAGLAAFGVELDQARNAAGERGRISAPGSREVFVFETDEESLLARSCAELLEREADGSRR